MVQLGAGRSAYARPVKLPQTDIARLWAPFFTMAIAGTIAVVLAQPFHNDGATEASFSQYVSPLISASVPIAVGAALLARRWSGLLTLCLGSPVAGSVGGVLYAMQSGADIGSEETAETSR